MRRSMMASTSPPTESEPITARGQPNIAITGRKMIGNR